MRRSAIASALVAVWLLAGGCPKPIPPSQRPLRIALYNEPLTLDPHHRNEVLTISVLRNIYEGLTALDARTNVEPALAERWETRGVTWVFHLRPGVRFHDGSSLTARDVVFSFNRARNSLSNVGGYLTSIDKVLASDQDTVTITTLRPSPTLLNKLAFVFIVPSGSPEEISRPIGTGPYELLAYEPGKRVALRASKSYWGGVAPEPEVEFLVVPKVDERVRLLLAGDVDLAQEPGPANVDRILDDSHCRVIEADSLNVIFLIIRSDRGALVDPRVRQAIHVALDRAGLVRAALHQKAMPISQMVGRSVFGYAPDLLLPEADPDKARELLIKAGYPRGLDLDIQFRPGRRPELEAVQEQLRPVGIRLRLKERPWAELFPLLLAGDIDFYFGGWLCLSGDSSDFFESMVHSRDAGRGYGGSNFNHYVNPALDDMIEKSSSIVDPLARRAQLQNCMRVLMSDLAFIPLYSPAVVFGARDNIEWQLRRDGLILANTIRRWPPAGAPWRR
jgi:peptide/nickel transport system substrate-binding protein